MEKYGANGDPEGFYWAVNLAYHSVESRSYEILHSDMYAGLSLIWERLLKAIPNQDGKFRILDIGAGTGLVGTLFDRIAHERVLEMTLLDPCPDMIERAKSNSREWRFPCRFVVGRPGMPTGELYDLVTMNSVLHHIPDLPGVCKAVKSYIRPSGYLITAQDPRWGYDHDSLFKIRAAKACCPRFNPLIRIMRSLRGMARYFLKGKYVSPLAAETSRRLIERGIIDKPMEADIIWSITDFHVPRQPFDIGRGINIVDLALWLGQQRPLAYFTYQYFGIPYKDLTCEYKIKEAELFHSGDLHGELFASVWKID